MDPKKSKISPKPTQSKKKRKRYKPKNLTLRLDYLLWIKHEPRGWISEAKPLSILSKVCKQPNVLERRYNGRVEDGECLCIPLSAPPHLIVPYCNQQTSQRSCATGCTPSSCSEKTPKSGAAIGCSQRRTWCFWRPEDRNSAVPAAGRARDGAKTAGNRSKTHLRENS